MQEDESSANRRQHNIFTQMKQQQQHASAFKFVDYHTTTTTTTTTKQQTTRTTTTTNKKKQKNRHSRKQIYISERQIKAHFIFSQPEAARRLGVSLSTLKRRFYELNGGCGGTMKWPYSEIKKIAAKRTIKYILNEREKDATIIDEYTRMVLLKAFQSTHGNNDKC
jgi:DNA-binding transcriptional regulator YiaG